MLVLERNRIVDQSMAHHGGDSIRGRGDGESRRRVRDGPLPDAGDRAESNRVVLVRQLRNRDRRGMDSMSDLIDERLRALLEAMPDAIIVVGPDGRIVLANSQ
ncbi:MAG: PAS domain-containing protein, partial [Xanthomonadales bacterium]|nr:PAS domain-containing protein [Xanthomonadales bacterium]